MKDLKKFLVGLAIFTIVLILLAALTGCGRHNGNDGTDGEDGTTTIIHEYLPAPEVGQYVLNGITPICGINTTGAEVVLEYKNTVTGEVYLLVSFSNNNAGDFTRLATLGVGTYKTTDQFACNFKVELINSQLSWRKL